MVIETRPLSPRDFDAVYRTFVLAFSDYVVAMSPTPEQLRELLTRRDPHRSPAGDGPAAVTTTGDSAQQHSAA